MERFIRGLAFCLALAVALGGLVSFAEYSACAGGSTVSGQGKVFRSQARQLETVRAADLPRGARRTLELIKKGGPFPYPKDGTTFRNREGVLPKHPTGYYKEYTVKTPGRRDRGARRIVAGSGGEFYYTSDHYRTFKLIKE